MLCSSYRFTKVAVDPQVKALDGKAYDILYVGTGEIQQLCVPQLTKARI